MLSSMVVPHFYQKCLRVSLAIISTEYYLLSSVSPFDGISGALIICISLIVSFNISNAC